MSCDNISSIGPQWPPEKSSFGRVKGIDNRRPVTKSTDFIDTVEAVVEVSRGYKHDPAVSRTSVRMVVDSKLLLSHKDWFSGIGEVSIPLTGTGAGLDDASILYLGLNAPGRRSDKTDLNNAMNNYAAAITRKPLSCRQILNRAEKDDFELKILESGDKNNKSIQTQMADLYKRFGWKPEEVVEMLNNATNILAVAIFNGSIVSAGIAETSVVNFGTGEKLAITELTEAATYTEFQGKGLYTAVAAILMTKLANIGESNLVFGECNGLAGGVLKAAKSLGRTISLEVPEVKTLNLKGYLEQHVPIETPNYDRLTEHNDLFPAFISKAGLMNFVNS